jgi:hypothetical protein
MTLTTEEEKDVKYLNAVNFEFSIIKRTCVVL